MARGSHKPFSSSSEEAIKQIAHMVGYVQSKLPDEVQPTVSDWVHDIKLELDRLEAHFVSPKSRIKGIVKVAKFLREEFKTNGPDAAWQTATMLRDELTLLIRQLEEKDSDERETTASRDE